MRAAPQLEPVDGVLTTACEGLAPYAGPATATLHLSLEERDGGTLFRLGEAIVGQVSEEMRQSLHDGWLQLFRDGLKRHVEGERV